MQRIAIIVLFGLLSSGANALGLLDARELALRNDAQFRAAGFERAAGLEEENIGRANLLPNLQYGYSANRSHSKVTQTDSFTNNTLKRDYNSYTSTLSLRQPLLDYAAPGALSTGCCPHADGRPAVSRSQSGSDGAVI